MTRDTVVGNLSFPGVRERIVPVPGSVRSLRAPWRGCGFGQQKVGDTCGELFPFPFTLTGTTH